MPPQLPTGRQRPSYFADLKTLVTLKPPNNDTRAGLAKSLLLRSIAVPISRDGRVRLPLRIRPAMVVLNALVLIFLGVLGFHPGSSSIPVSDKVLHFVSFLLSSLLFFFIFDPSSSPSQFWSHLPLYLSIFVCLVIGGIGSEFVQSLLPYKVFDWGDILANLAGVSLGLALAWKLEKEWRIRREIKRLYQPLDFDDEEALGGYADDEGLLPHDEEDDASYEARIAGTQGHQRRQSIQQQNQLRKNDPDLENPWTASMPKEYEGNKGGSQGRVKEVAANESSSHDLFSIDDEDDDDFNEAGRQAADGDGSQRSS